MRQGGATNRVKKGGKLAKGKKDKERPRGLNRRLIQIGSVRIVIGNCNVRIVFKNLV